MGKHQKDDFSYWAFQAQKQRLRHTQTAGPWRTEKHQNCDQKLPNVQQQQQEEKVAKIIFFYGFQKLH